MYGRTQYVISDNVHLYPSVGMTTSWVICDVINWWGILLRLVETAQLTRESLFLPR